MTNAVPSNNFSIVWIRSSKNEQCDKVFHRLVGHIRIFDKIEDCERYIREATGDRLILVVDKQFCQELILCIHSLPQILSIYIYNVTKGEDQQWAKNFIKIRKATEKLENSISVLEYHLKKRFEMEEPLWIDINSNTIEENHYSSTSINGDFLHSQLIIAILRRIAPNTQDKDEFIRVCEREYQNNASTLAKIQQFYKTYSSTTALWWYTSDTFLYRILNKSLRLFNIHHLFLLRFFIHDLYNELLRRQSQQSRSSIVVYRSQSMSGEELARLRQSIGKVISMRSFLSTSIDRDVCLLFMSNDPNERILFEINVEANKYTSSKPFANIADASAVHDEEEILFMLGSIFRLNKIFQQNDGIWIIQMSLCSDEDDDLKSLFQHSRCQLEDPDNPLLQFAAYLREAGFYLKAEQVCQRVLDELKQTNDRFQIAKCFHELGSLYEEQDKLDDSLKWYQKALAIEEELHSPNEASTRTGMGLVYHKQDQLDQALEQFEKVLKIIRNFPNDNNERIAGCLSNIARTYAKKALRHPLAAENLERALQYQQHALDIREKCLPKYHPHLAASYEQIGLIYLKFGKFNEALENLQRTLEIREKSLPSTHYEIGFVYTNLGSVLYETKEYTQAKCCFEKALAIYQKNSFSDNHCEVVKVKENIEHANQALTMANDQRQ